MRYKMAYTGIRQYNKYRNEKVNGIDGVFDSKYELEEWCKLKFLEKSGKISNLRRQVTYELIPNQKTSEGTIRGVKYIADFVYNEDGIEYVNDTKGFETPDYKIKKKLLLFRYPDLVFVERKKGKQPKIYRREK